jgi:formiminoglutamase
MAVYRETLPSAWDGRIDGTDEDLLRWHQLIQLSTPEKLPKLAKGEQGIAFIGYCCDAGIERNFGRTGAAAAPAIIRSVCSNFPMVARHIKMADAGDIVCADNELEAAQELLAEKIAAVTKSGYLPIVFGGGQDAGYGIFKGITPLPKKDKEYGLINFDAHFDLRAPGETGSTSGTWAWQIEQACRQLQIPLHYLVLGIQQYSNTRRLFDTAAELGSPYFLAEQFTNDQLTDILQKINGIIANSDCLQLSIDMDVFASAFAPGVSASSFNGLAPNAMFKRLLRHIVLSGKVAAIDVSEVNPAFDVDNRTARLAAAFIFDIVQAADINAEYPG